MAFCELVFSCPDGALMAHPTLEAPLPELLRLGGDIAFGRRFLGVTGPLGTENPSRRPRTLQQCPELRTGPAGPAPARRELPSTVAGFPWWNLEGPFGSAAFFGGDLRNALREDSVAATTSAREAMEALIHQSTLYPLTGPGTGAVLTVLPLVSESPQMALVEGLEVIAEVALEALQCDAPSVDEEEATLKLMPDFLADDLRAHGGLRGMHEAAQRHARAVEEAFRQHPEGSALAQGMRSAESRPLRILCEAS